MATLAAIGSLPAVCRFESHSNPRNFPSPSSLSSCFLSGNNAIRMPNLQSHGHGGLRSSSKHPAVRNPSKLRKIRSVAEETTAPEEQSPSQSQETASADQPVSVPVSPSDKLIMFFQAEGTMNETAISMVTKALEGTEGVANLRVQLVERIASVELTKQTTVQATGVASSLVETIQGSGFKLQTLNLSFEEEDVFSQAL